MQDFVSLERGIKVWAGVMQEGRRGIIKMEQIELGEFAT